MVDRGLPGLDGPSVATIARREGLPTRVLILADGADGRAVLAAVSAGAAAYLTKDSEPSELAAALRAVAAGDVVLPPGVVTCLAREIRLRHRSDRPALTARERGILALVADDCTTREIAASMHLSTATVKSYLQRAYEKLDVRDRPSAVAAAMRLGLVE
jgi:two-component system nitrate/nitrite response regulator NarL